MLDLEPSDGHLNLPLSNESQLSNRLVLPLRETTVHKQFRPCDVAAVVGGEKSHGLRDLIGCPEPAERNHGGNHLLALLAHF